jgi:hypothetical protein
MHVALKDVKGSLRRGATFLSSKLTLAITLPVMAWTQLPTCPGHKIKPTWQAALPVTHISPLVLV